MIALTAFLLSHQQLSQQPKKQGKKNKDLRYYCQNTKTEVAWDFQLILTSMYMYP